MEQILGSSLIKNMTILARILRACLKFKNKIIGYATIKDVPTDQFNQIIKALSSSGWNKTYEYAGIDAWIDYGKIKLKNNGCKLVFEWDNWTQGRIEGPTKAIERLAKEYNLQVSKL